jgi:hypothetical protein
MKCCLCPAEADYPEDNGWVPSFFIGDEEISDPVCPDCFLYFMVFSPEYGDFEMRPYLVDKTPYGESQDAYADGYGCPCCNELRHSQLEFLPDDNRICCRTCGTEFDGDLWAKEDHPSEFQGV